MMTEKASGSGSTDGVLNDSQRFCSCRLSWWTMQFSSSDHKNNNLRKSVFTKMSKTEDLLVSQLSS